MNVAQPTNRSLPLSKKLAFSLIVLLIACLPLALMELLLVLTWRESAAGPRETRDPFIGFSGQQTLFAADADGEFFRIRESRLGYFQPARFRVDKPPDGFRVFVVGGSTVQGRPWEPATAFGKWLELGLASCQPEWEVEVINCGGVSYASYRLSRIVEEIVEYSPDLVILCTGHNEYLENRTYAAESRVSEASIQLHRMLSRLATYRWLRGRILDWRAPSSASPVLDEQVITRLDYENGLEQFSEQTLQRDRVCQHFRFNLEKMIATVLEREIRLLVLAPPGNQKDCFPFKPHAGWSPGDVSAWADWKLDEFSSVPAPDRGADYYFLRGLRRLDQGDRAARSDFQQAIDLDLCPLRMTSEQRRLMDRVVRSAQRRFGREQVLYLDLRELCADVSPHGIVGRELLVDHVHPSISTHRRVAGWILERLQDRGIIDQPAGWISRYHERIASHEESLDFGYFQRGKERLDSVLRWSRGQARRPWKIRQ